MWTEHWVNIVWDKYVQVPVGGEEREHKIKLKYFVLRVSGRTVYFVSYEVGTEH